MRNTGRGASLSVLTSVAILLLVGNIVQPPAELAAQTAPRGEVVWPPPPEQPRIRYAGYLHSEIDVGKELSFAAKVKRTLLGTRESMIGLRRPHDVYVGEPPRFYVTDKGHRGLVVFDVERKAAEVWTGEGPGQLRRPMGVGGDGQGRIYVTDPGTQRVVVFDTSGAFIHTFGGPQVLRNPIDVVVDADRDRVYVVDSHLHQIVVFNRNGDLLERIGRQEVDPDTLEAPPPLEPGHRGREQVGGPSDLFANRGSGSGEFRFPTFAALAPDGTLYVTDALNSRIQAFDPSGRYLREFGRPGDTPGSFARPKGVAVDAEGHVYVVDAAFSNVQIFDGEGRLLLAFGSMGRGGGQLWLPEAIHINSEGQVYVVDSVNSRVQIFEYLAEASAEPERRMEP